MRKKGELAELKMKKVLGVNTLFDENKYICRKIRYDAKQECIYLVLEDDDITEISLDAIYECVITLKGEKIACTGRVKERYNSEPGQILKFEIENGFYKINVNSVDK